MHRLLFVLVSLTSLLNVDADFGLGNRFSRWKCAGCRDPFYYGLCHLVNSEWQRDCTTYQCQQVKLESGLFHYERIIKNGSCLDSYHGLCHLVNSEWQKNCITYQCQQVKLESGLFHYETVIKDGSCMDSKGECHNVTSRWQEGCSTYECQKKNVFGTTSYASIITDGGCKDTNGSCHKVNSEWSEGCVTYGCRERTQHYNYNRNYGRAYHTVIKNLQCHGVNGQCSQSGERVLVQGPDLRFLNCRCTISGLNIYYNNCTTQDNNNT